MRQQGGCSHICLGLQGILVVKLQNDILQIPRSSQQLM
ncbi:unnamed protein product [Rhodiola kirilowii]